MAQYEHSSTQETVSQQFIDYVRSHSEPISTEIEEVTREGHWQLNVRLPLFGDTINKVTFLERGGITSDNSPTDESGYDVILDTRKGLDAIFTYEPTNPDSLYWFSGHESAGYGPITETEIADLLAELKGYEAAGLMTKMETPSGDR